MLLAPAAAAARATAPPPPLQLPAAAAAPVPPVALVCCCLHAPALRPSLTLSRLRRPLGLSPPRLHPGALSRLANTSVPLMRTDTVLLLQSLWLCWAVRCRQCRQTQAGSWTPTRRSRRSLPGHVCALHLVIFLPTHPIWQAAVGQKRKEPEQSRAIIPSPAAAPARGGAGPAAGGEQTALHTSPACSRRSHIAQS